MASITFDTLKLTKRVEATGTELVTKDYLKAEIETAKNDLIKWIAGLLLAQAGLVTALVKLLS
jgi:hypothetical protein